MAVARGAKENIVSAATRVVLCACLSVSVCVCANAFHNRSIIILYIDTNLVANFIPSMTCLLPFPNVCVCMCACVLQCVFQYAVLCVSVVKCFMCVCVVLWCTCVCVCVMNGVIF